MQDETINYQYYKVDKLYKQSSNLVNYWNQMQDYYEGRQERGNYPKGVPFVMANLCKYLINTKSSKLRGTPYTITFQSASEEATNKLNKFDKFVLLDIGYNIGFQESIINMGIYGNSVVMYRFSDSGVSLNALYEGKLVREEVDLRRFAVANPYINDIQAQEWVMYWSSLEVKAIRDLCEQFEDESNAEFKRRVASIVPDDYTDEKYPSAELISHGICTVYTRYFRVNGEVCFQSSTKTVDLFSPRFLSPEAEKSVLRDLEKKRKEKTGAREELNKVDDYDIDPEDANIEARKDRMTETEYQSHLSKFSLYPFEVYSSHESFNHFYGKSDLQDVIPAQDAINFFLTMSCKNIQDNAWGKWIVSKDALHGQKINNSGGQVLVDYSRTGNGIKRAEGNTSNMLNVNQYIDTMTSMIKSFEGANETISGEYASQLSGYAISLLQEQANTVFEMEQAKLWEKHAVNEGKIRLQFYLHYYDKNVSFIYERDDLDYEREKRAREQIMNADLTRYANGITQEQPRLENYPQVSRRVETTFSSKEVGEHKYYIVPKAGRGIKYSEVVQADQINQLFKDGTIANLPNYLMKAYIELNPLIDDTTKSNFKKILEAQEESENAQLHQTVSQLTSQIQQYQGQIQQLQAQLEAAKAYTQNLQTSFKEKINAANQVNKIQNQALQSYSKESSSKETSDLTKEGLKSAIAG